MNVGHEKSGITTLFGTPQDVKTQLSKLHSKQVLVLSVGEHMNTMELQSLAVNISGVAKSMIAVMRTRQDEQVLERLAEVLVPRAPTSPRLLKEASMIVQARKAVLESGDWLTAAQVAQLAGLSKSNPSAQPHKWKKLGQIFAIHHNGTDYYPGYGFDPENNFRPHKVLARIIAVFDGHKKDWGMAFWFFSVNSFLGGKRPQDLISTEPELVLQAAEDEVQVIEHA